MSDDEKQQPKPGGKLVAKVACKAVEAAAHAAPPSAAATVIGGAAEVAGNVLAFSALKGCDHRSGFAERAAVAITRRPAPTTAAEAAELARDSTFNPALQPRVPQTVISSATSEPTTPSTTSTNTSTAQTDLFQQRTRPSNVHTVTSSSSSVHYSSGSSSSNGPSVFAAVAGGVISVGFTLTCSIS